VDQAQSSRRSYREGGLSNTVRGIVARSWNSFDELTSWILGVVFIASAFAHWLNPYLFLSSVYAYGVLGPGTGQAVAMVLPALQVIVGGCLVSHLWRDAAHTLALSMLFSFLVVQGVALIQGLDISCGCFGQCTSSPIGPRTVFPVVGLFLLCALRMSLRLRGETGGRRLVEYFPRDRQNAAALYE
jgi:hypothetical protein